MLSCFPGGITFAVMLEFPFAGTVDDECLKKLKSARTKRRNNVMNSYTTVFTADRTVVTQGGWLALATL